jgi:hypothetical protein
LSLTLTVVRMTRTNPRPIFEEVLSRLDGKNFVEDMSTWRGKEPKTKLLGQNQPHYCCELSFYFKFHSLEDYTTLAGSLGKIHLFQTNFTFMEIHI